MSHSIQTLEAALHDVLGGKVKLLESALGELTLTVSAADYHDVCKTLRDDSRLGFEQLMDLCGLDYSSYKDGAHSKFTDGPRYAVVSHLLSVSHNWRLRVRVFAVSEDVPVIASVNDLWNSANWFEREAFDAKTCLWLPLSTTCGTRPTGSSAKRLTCLASCSKVTSTCVVC